MVGISYHVEDFYKRNGLRSLRVYGQLQGEGAYFSSYYYDSHNHLQSVIHRRSNWTRFAGMEYVSRDEIGNPTEVREYFGSGMSDFYTSVYTYDDWNRLTGWSLNGTPRGSWSYDQVGNWNMTGWDTDDQVDWLSASPSETYGYHPNGALKWMPATGTPVESFGYNDQDLMSMKSNSSQGQVTFMKWDHAGRRVELWASSSGDTWHYIYDPTASIPAILAEVKNQELMLEITFGFSARHYLKGSVK